MAELWVTTSLKRQAIGEAIAYSIDYTDVGTPGAAGTVAVYNSTGGDLSSTLLTGSASLSGNTVTLKLFTPTTAGYYRLINTVTISGNTVKGGVEVDVYDPTATQAISSVYCTLAEFKHYAKLENTDTIDDNVIAAIIEGASRLIDDMTGRTFYARTETHYFSVTGERNIKLDDDLLTVTSLTNGNATVLTTSDYYLWPRNKSPYQEVWLKESSSYVWEPDSSANYEYSIALAGTWGYAATAPSDVRQATLEVAHAEYKRRFGENQTDVSTTSLGGVMITPRDIPAYAMAVIRRYRRRT
jgi:hypothetical protein